MIKILKFIKNIIIYNKKDVKHTIIFIFCFINYIIKLGKLDYRREK